MNISGFLSDIVTSKDNPSVKRFRKLMTSKRNVFITGFLLLREAVLFLTHLKIMLLLKNICH